MLVGDGEWQTGHAVAHFSERTWQFTDAKSSCSYAPKDEGAIVNGGKTKKLARDRDGWMPEGLELLFPLDLPLWGGKTDEWTIVDAVVRGGHAHLSLQHKGDPELSAIASIRLDWGVIAEFNTPWSEAALRDLRPASQIKEEAAQDGVFDFPDGNCEATEPRPTILVDRFAPNGKVQN